MWIGCAAIVSSSRTTSIGSSSCSALVSHQHCPPSLTGQIHSSFILNAQTEPHRPRRASPASNHPSTYLPMYLDAAK